MVRSTYGVIVTVVSQDSVLHARFGGKPSRRRMVVGLHHTLGASKKHRRRLGVWGITEQGVCTGLYGVAHIRLRRTVPRLSGQVPN